MQDIHKAVLFAVVGALAVEVVIILVKKVATELIGRLV